MVAHLDIKGLITASDVQVNFTESNLPSGQTASKAYLTVKQHKLDLDSAAIFQKVITTTQVTGQGQITNDGTGDVPVTGYFELTNANTALLAPFFSETDKYMAFYFDIKIITSAGKATPSVEGLILAEKGITDAVS